MKKVLSIMILTIVFIRAAEAPAKNLILLIGDGMGPAVIDLARVCLKGQAGYLAFEKSKALGQQRTWSADSLVTDSAAAGTAIACGVKTYNKYLGMGTNGLPVKSLLEYVKASGKSAGLVTTVSITHATPAAFASHQNSRSEMPVAEEYARNFAADVFFGGGRDFFLPYNSGGQRADNRNIVSEFTNAGYTYFSDEAELDSKAVPVKALGLFSANSGTAVIDRSDAERISGLTHLTEKALKILSANKKGFFLMAEAGQIDWRMHENDPAAAVREIEELEQTWLVCSEFAAANPGTLIVLTADHETGGLVLSSGRYQWNPDVLMAQKMSLVRLSSQMSNRTAEEKIGLLYENTGVKNITAEQKSIFNTNTTAAYLGLLVRNAAEVICATGSHSGISVPVYAHGARCGDFNGVYDNTDLYIKMKNVMGLR